MVKVKTWSTTKNYQCPAKKFSNYANKKLITQYKPARNNVHQAIGTVTLDFNNNLFIYMYNYNEIINIVWVTTDIPRQKCYCDMRAVYLLTFLTFQVHFHIGPNST